MIASALERLMDLIGYPREDRAGDGKSSVLAVDDYRIAAEVRGGKLVLCWDVAAEAEDFETLAGYAAGRILAEAATLAYDPERQTLLLWQEVDVGVTDRELVEAMQSFLDSCDWWSARIDDLKARGKVTIPEMVIRP